MDAERILSIVILLLAGLTCGARAPQRRDQKAEHSGWLPSAVSWRADYKHARAEAGAKAMPLLLLLRSKHCPWCDKLENEMTADPEVSRMLACRVVPLKLYVERERELFAALHIDVFPTTVLASADGKILGSLKGFQKADTVRQALLKALQGEKALP